MGRRKAAAAVQTAAGGTPKGVKDHPLAMQINNTIKIIIKGQTLQDQKNGSYLSSRKPTKNTSQDQERQRRSPGSIRPAQIRTIWRRLSRGVRGGGRSLWIYGGRGEPGIARGGPWNLRWEFGDHKEEAEVARGVVRLRRVASIKGRRWRLGRCRCACLYFFIFSFLEV